MSISRPRWWIILAWCALTVPPTVSAANPPSELLRLVPEDVGFCLVVPNLREHGSRLANAPWAKAFRESPIGRGTDWRGLEALDELLKKQLGVDWDKIRDEILGDAFVLAYRPGPPGKPHEEQGLLLLQARDARLLEKLVETINRAQEQSGEVKEVLPCEHQGEKYFRRVQQKGDDFYALREGALLLATREEMLRDVLGRLHDRKTEGALAKRLGSLAKESTLASLWINPRAFDAEMKHNLQNAQGRESAFLRNFLRYWEAIDGAALTLEVDADIRLSLTMESRREALPAAARKFFQEAARPSELLSRLPQDAFLGVAGRIHFESLFEMIGEFLPPEDNQAFRTAVERTVSAVIGKDFFKEVLPRLGPSCALCIAPPPSKDSNWFPHVFLELCLGDGENRDASLEEGLLDVVDLAVGAGVVAFNQERNARVSIRTTIQDKVKVKYLVAEQGFPPGFRPAYALQHRYLTFGSSPEALDRCRACLTSTAAPKENQPICWVSFENLRRFLKERRAAVIEHLAEKDRIESKEAQERLDKLLGLLELVDRIEIAEQVRQGQLNVTLRVRMAQGLVPAK